MKNKLYQDKIWLLEKYKKYECITEIAKIADVSDGTIAYWLKKHNIEFYHYKNKKREHFINEHFFKTIDTEEKAYWLGFIMADGCISTNGKCSKNASIMSIVLKKQDYNHLVKFLKAIESDYPIKTKKIYDARGFSSENCSIKISCLNMCNDLKKYGVVQRKTGLEKIPKIPYSLTRHFVRGFFDGDGSLTKSLSFRICSASKTIIEQISSFFLSEIDVNANYQTYEENNKPFFIYETRKKMNVYNILQLLYADATIYLDRKHERVKSAIVSLQSNLSKNNL